MCIEKLNLKSVKALILKMLQRGKQNSKKNILVRGDRFRNITLKHFQLNEFDCKCGECSYKGDNMDIDFMLKLDRARELADIPFKITSGARCLEHNKSIGGVPKSSHCNIPCNASDISATDSTKRFKIVENLIKAGFTRIGIGKNFIHCDTDKLKSQRICWHYY
jgi:zinc D-Ala-D-Ala carboxypeptidase